MCYPCCASQVAELRTEAAAKAQAEATRLEEEKAKADQEAERLAQKQARMQDQIGRVAATADQVTLAWMRFV